jgi:hypothetical protein
MKRISTLLAVLLTVIQAHAADKTLSYEMGIYVSSSVATDGTITSTLHGDGTTVAGSVYQNHVAVYQLKVADGYWHLETYTQNKDSMLRQMGMTPMHFKSEKDNPLDFLKGGEKVLFRVERHRKINGTEISVYIPYADNPNKEFHFIGYFYPDAMPYAPQKATDNVKAMCDAHKLSPELEKQYCSITPTAAPPIPPSPYAATVHYSPTDIQTAKNLSAMSCAQIQTTILSNTQLAVYLPYTVQTAKARCQQ